MKKVYQQIIQSVVLLTCLFSVSGAQAATVFNISFFDQNNAQVGSGQFSVDFGGVVCVETNPSGDCGSDPGNIFATTTKTNPLTGFSANIQRIPWGFEAGPTWWNAQGQPAGSQGVTRGGPFMRDGWFFGDPFFGTRTLGMSISRDSNAISGSGGWSQQIQVSDPSVPGGIVGGSGTWTAAATPIPAAVWLFASGLGLLGVFKSKVVKE